jgi:acetyltransferase-like isoleucine patch superfamily enzyme
MIARPDIDVNIPHDSSSASRLLRRIANRLRTFYLFNIRFPWIVRRGFVRIPLSVSIWSPDRKVFFGHRVQLGPRCTIQTNISFGDSILVAGEVAFIGRYDHRTDLVGNTVWGSPRGECRGIVIEDDVWIGWRATVLDGVVIGRGAVVAACAVVTRTVPPYTVVAGVPARPIGTRFNDAQIALHESKLLMSGNPHGTPGSCSALSDAPLSEGSPGQ